MSDDFDDIYGTKFFGAAALNGQRRRVKISEVTREDLREQDGRTKPKYVIRFENEEKALPLNKTNALRLAKAFGKPRSSEDARAKWVGRIVELYSEMTSLGKEGVRLQPLQQRQAPPVQPEPELEEIPY
jgi:hypothetical protein